MAYLSQSFVSEITDRRHTILNRYTSKSPDFVLYIGEILKGDICIHPPEIAIMPSIHIGECWLMVGSQRQIAISLIQPIVVSSIAIEHASRYKAITLSSILCGMELWGQPTNANCIAKICELTHLDICDPINMVISTPLKEMLTENTHPSTIQPASRNHYPDFSQFIMQ
ncbi:LOW QUALITY PROTEIN: hypothetical protein BC938DRAFT_470984 [Jimgerdemannia flammicorona]|uniref:SUN domain-containing protein n=1 Tax=Jimgerdemannia flammicorona TaxID=994334 RepID=A0A433QUW8_9FUNG|nr:LOW QUALITY PROTEIN: hypothetical protein BC938DRAFT_470984 [Jimgerdemannia flammicorona]